MDSALCMAGPDHRRHCHLDIWLTLLTPSPAPAREETIHLGDSLAKEPAVVAATATVTATATGTSTAGGGEPRLLTCCLILLRLVGESGSGRGGG